MPRRSCLSLGDAYMPQRLAHQLQMFRQQPVPTLEFLNHEMSLQSI